MTRLNVTRSAILLALLAACSTGTGYAPPRPAARPGNGTPADSARKEPAPGGIRRWAAHEQRYDVIQADTLVLRYPQGNQTQVIHRMATLQVQLRDLQGGATQLSVRLDSLRAMEIPRDSLIIGDGLLWTAEIDPSGRVGPFIPLRPAPLVEQLMRPALAALVFPIPPDGLRDGAVWDDSTAADRKLLTVDVTEHAVTRYSAAASPGGISVTATAALKASGSGAAFGQTLEISATGNRQQQHLLRNPGILQSATGRDSLDVAISIPAVGQTVPATRIAAFQLAPR